MVYDDGKLCKELFEDDLFTVRRERKWTLNDNSCVCFDQHLIVVVVSKPSESLLYQCRVKTLINHFGERTGTSKQSGFLNFP